MSNQDRVWLSILLIILLILLLLLIGAVSSQTTTITTTTTTTVPQPATSSPAVKKPAVQAAPTLSAKKPVALTPAPAPSRATTVDLPVAAELNDRNYNRRNWTKSWTSAVNNYLGWGASNCRYAFYETTGNCHSRNHRDHVVALREAYDSGGYRWSTTRKKQFYVYLPNLYEMLGSANSSKSSRDPAEWKPANRSAWCRYATEWIAVKKYWQLSADAAEISALQMMLNTC